MNYPLRLVLLAAVLASGRARPAAAQQPAVYTYVEQMPALPGRPGPDAIRQAIARNFHLPAADLRARTAGRLFVASVVTATGDVTDVRLVKGLTATADAAAVRAVRQLPRLTPGRQGGRPVSVALTLPVTVGGSGPATALTEERGTILTVRDPAGNGPPAGHQEEGATAVTVRGNTDADFDLSDLSGEGNRPATEIDDNRVFTYVEQMPQLPGGGGQAAIMAAMQRQLVVPADAPEGRVFVKFTVDKEGKVQSAEVVKGLGASADAAALAAVRKLPAFEPGKQNGRKVSVSYTLPLTVRQPSPALPAR